MSARLTVLQVAYPFAAVRPQTAGGAEQVLAALDRALAAAGHRSVVVAAEGSRAAGELVATPARRGEIDAAARQAAWAAHRDAIARALAASPRPDVVHYHGLDFPAYLHPAGPPAVVTLHLPPAWYAAAAWAGPAARLCCVSRAQARALPAAAAARARVIENGVDLDRFRPASRRGRFALWLGRVCPEKAPHRAIAAARRAGVPLLLAGEVHPYAEHRAYFARAVAPALGRGVRWLGAVGGEAKARLLARARCLVLAGEAPETSSLAALEALASGTPVVANPVGALPEIVDDGRTGFLAGDEPALAVAIARVEAIDPSACRRAAEERWDERRMVADYLALYREASATLGAGRPRLTPPPPPPPRPRRSARSSPRPPPTAPR